MGRSISLILLFLSNYTTILLPSMIIHKGLRGIKMNNRFEMVDLVSECAAGTE